MNVWCVFIKSVASAEAANIWTELEHIIDSLQLNSCLLTWKYSVMANGKCDVVDRGCEVDLLAFEVFFFFYMGETQIWAGEMLLSHKVEGGVWSGGGGECGGYWSGDSVHECQLALSKDDPKHPKQSRESCEWTELILISSANWALNGFSVLTTQGWGCNTAAALAL